MVRKLRFSRRNSCFAFTRVDAEYEFTLFGKCLQTAKVASAENRNKTI